MNARDTIRFGISLCFCCAVTLMSCSKSREDNKRERNKALIKKEINTYFKGAVPFKEYTDSLLFFLYAIHKIAPDKILLGQSTCVDDVISSRNPFEQHNVRGPFNFGGLAGLPFAGTTGINAFTSHVPDSGAAVLFMGPHIGYSLKGGWGKIEREGQDELTNCCGALSEALLKLQQPGGIERKTPGAEDYQEGEIEQLALRNKDEILNSAEPLITFTKLMCNEIEFEIQPSRFKGSKINYIILINGVIINTDHIYPDYIWIHHMTVYDLKTGKELESMHN